MTKYLIWIFHQIKRNKIKSVPILMTLRTWNKHFIWYKYTLKLSTKETFIIKNVTLPTCILSADVLYKCLWQRESWKDCCNQIIISHVPFIYLCYIFYPLYNTGYLRTFLKRMNLSSQSFIRMTWQWWHVSYMLNLFLFIC